MKLSMVKIALWYGISKYPIPLRKSLKGYRKAIFLLLLVPGSLYAAPCYGPNMPEKGKWEIGAQANILFKRNMEKTHGEFKSSQYFITLSYGIFDWLSLDGKLGAGDIIQKPENEDELGYNVNFAGAYGFRLHLFQNGAKKIRAVAGFQHISVHPDSRDVSGIKNDCIMDDWQASLLFSRDYKRISPYLGFKLSRSDLMHKIAEGKKRKKSEDLFGLFTGADFYLSDKLRLNLEARFLDESAVSAALIRKF